MFVKRFAIVVDSVQGLENPKVLEDLILGLSSKLMEEEIALDREKRKQSRRRGCPYKLTMGRAW